MTQLDKYHEALIDDTPPTRVHDMRDLVDVVIAFLVGIAVVLAAVYLRGATLGVQSDAQHASTLLPWLVELPMSFLQQIASLAIVLTVVIQLLLRAQWLQSISAAIAMFLGFIASQTVTTLIIHFGSPTLLYALTGSLSPVFTNAQIIPANFAGIAAFLSAAGTHRMHSSVRWSWNILCIIATVTVIVDFNPLASVAWSIALGRCIGLLIRFIVGIQNKGAWGDDIVSALSTLGFRTHSLTRLDADALISAQSAIVDSPNLSSKQSLFTGLLSTFDDQTPHSRIYLAQCSSTDIEQQSTPAQQFVSAQQSTPAQQSTSTQQFAQSQNFNEQSHKDQENLHTYIISVNDEHTSAANYLSQLWQILRLASGISLRTDRSVSQSSHHHADFLLMLSNIGIRVPHVLARTEVKESAITVLEDGQDFVLPRWDDICDDDIVAMLTQLKQAHRKGITHRHITAYSFAWHIPTHQLVLSGWNQGDDASSATTIALDVIQVLTALGCHISIARTITCAQQVWDNSSLTSLVPFVQRVAVPRGTTSQPQWDRHILGELRTALNNLLPDNDTENIEAAPIARFSVKNIITWALIIIAVSITVTQINPHEFIVALESSNPWIAGLCFLFGIASWIGSGLALGVFIDPAKRHPAEILASQAVGTFTTASMPAGVGPAVINLQYVRKCGYRTTTASAIMSAVVTVQGITIMLLLLLIGLFTGRNMLSGMIPTNLTIGIISAIALISSAAMVIPYTRRIILNELVPRITTFAQQLFELLSRPRTIALAALGWLLQSVLLGLSFWAALLAFGQHTNPLETIFMFVLTNTVASAVPTPGGLGAIEAALALGFTSLGVPYAVALSATLLFRLLTYWLRLPIGAIALQWMNKRQAL